MKKDNRYLRILKAHDKNGVFYEIASDMMDKDGQVQNKVDSHLDNIFSCVISPVLIIYVLWILNHAKQQRTKRIFFLARDGYILYNIANTILKRMNIQIDCTYLYCSRMSLRRALFYVDEQIGYSYLFEYRRQLCLMDIFNRLRLPKQERDIIINELGLSREELTQVMSEHDVSVLKQSIISSETCKEVLRKRSKIDYDNTIGYFHEVGLMDEQDIVIADVGWMGSMQKSLRIICEKEKKTKLNITGYYFGIMNDMDPRDGHFFAYYLNNNENPLRKVQFNQNVFECFCSANHGMTIGYTKGNNRFSPVFDGYEDMPIIDGQINTIIRYTEMLTRHKRAEELIETDHIQVVYKLLRAFMSKPKPQDAQTYGMISFCGDYSNTKFDTLISDLSFKDIVKYGIASAAGKQRAAFGNKYGDKTYWIHGSIARLPFGLLKLLFQVNIKLWDFAKLIAFSLSQWLRK